VRRVCLSGRWCRGRADVGRTPAGLLSASLTGQHSPHLTPETPVRWDCVGVFMILWCQTRGPDFVSQLLWQVKSGRNVWMVLWLCQTKAPDNFYILATVIGQYWTPGTHVEWPDSGYYFICNLLWQVKHYLFNFLYIEPKNKLHAEKRQHSAKRKIEVI